MALRFFLGANSKEGFVSLFPRLKAEESRRIFCIKSGPGCGKSTCMAHLAAALGGAKEEFLCSSDPGSLDGVLLPGLAILDGTAPHVFEPDFPGCDGDYLTLPAFLDPAGLESRRPELLALKAASRQHYARAYRLIAAAALTRDEVRQTLASLLPPGALEKRALSLCRREIPKGSGRAVIRRRFLDGVTPEGLLFLGDTVPACARRIIALRDSFGLTSPLLETLAEGAADRGQESYLCLDPVEPDRVRHLLLPGCSLAFVTDDGRTPLPFVPTRTLHIDRMLPPAELRSMRGRLRLLRRTEDALLGDAVAAIAVAHALHDRIEDIYRPHIDVSAMESCYAGLLSRLRREV